MSKLSLKLKLTKFRTFLTVDTQLPPFGGGSFFTNESPQDYESLWAKRAYNKKFRIRKKS